MSKLIDNYINRSKTKDGVSNLLTVVRDAIKTCGDNEVVQDLCAAIVRHLDRGVKTRKRPRDLFKWVANVAGTDKTKQHIYKRVRVINDKLVATDGYRIHIARNDYEAYKNDNDYTLNGDPITYDSDFPDVSYFLDIQVTNEHRIQRTDFMWADLTSDGARVLKVTLGDNTLYFDAQYIDDLFNCANSMYCNIPKSSLDRLALVSLDGERKAVIMPMRWKEDQ